MNGRGAYSLVSATPEQILGILQDIWPLEQLSISSSVSDLLNCSMATWRELARMLNSQFKVNISQEEWRCALKPHGKRTLRDVCNLLARHVSLPQISRLKALGANCPTGAAFLALRDEINATGLDAKRIRPSTPLNQWLRLHSENIISATVRLLPGKLPKIRWTVHPAYKLSAWTFLIGLIVVLASSSVNFPPLLVFAAVFACGLGFISFVITSHLPPAEVRMEKIVTFGDLARLIATAQSAITRFRIESIIARLLYFYSARPWK